MDNIRTIFRERLHRTDNRLGRHVLHDSESRRFPFPTTGIALQSTTHERHIPIFDQGNVGSCTADAGIGCLGTGTFYATVKEIITTAGYDFSQSAVLRFYSDEENLDGDGPYPPQDNGSTGLTCAQVLKQHGLISGYQHTFTLDDALKALTQTPFITGVNWYEGMFTPTADGQVQPTGSIAGGHEFVAFKLDVENERIWFANSWGEGWGVNGTFWMTWSDFGRLLGEQGDVTVFVPLSQPAPTPTPPAPTPPDPTPTPVPPEPTPTPPAPPQPTPPGPVNPDAATPADVVLAGRVRHWAFGKHIIGNARAAAAVRTWLRKKNLT